MSELRDLYQHAVLYVCSSGVLLGLGMLALWGLLHLTAENTNQLAFVMRDELPVGTIPVAPRQELVYEGVYRGAVPRGAEGGVRLTARFDLGVSVDTNLVIRGVTDGFAFRNVKERTVSFTDGRTKWIPFQADSPVTNCVRSASGAIDWKVRDSTLERRSGPHRYYVVLDEPQRPWVTGGDDPQNPWTEALDFACAAANGECEATNVMARLTQALFSNGCQYDSLRGTNMYTNIQIDRFDFGGYLRRSNGSKVNCYDQAYALHSSAAMVGLCPEIKLKQPFGQIRTVCLVGGVRTNNPFYEDTQKYCPHVICMGDDHDGGVVRSPFVNHMYVVFKRKVYDACVGPTIGDKTEPEYWDWAVESGLDNSIPQLYYPRRNDYGLQQLE